MTRKALTAEEWLEEHLSNDFGTILRGKSAIAAALVAAALLENALMTLLHSFFIQDERTNALFRVRGTLESFSKCAEMAYCLGLISEAMLKNLERVGKIRNRFAHSMSLPNFNDQQISDLCAALTFPTPADKRLR